MRDRSWSNCYAEEKDRRHFPSTSIIWDIVMRDQSIDRTEAPSDHSQQAERYWRGPVRQGRSTMARTATAMIEYLMWKKRVFADSTRQKEYHTRKVGLHGNPPEFWLCWRAAASRSQPPPRNSYQSAMARSDCTRLQAQDGHGCPRNGLRSASDQQQGSGHDGCSEMPSGINVVV
jgi:hypothetical protein